MKVELSKIRLAKSVMTDNIYVGVPEKDMISFKEKHDVTADFLKAVVDRFMGYKQVITLEGKPVCEITCKKLNKKLKENKK